MTGDTLFGVAAPSIAWGAATLAVLTTAAVLVERTAFGLGVLRRRRLEARYVPLVRRALAGDTDAEAALVSSPRRFRLDIASLLIAPLVDDRDPARIARTRHIVTAMDLLADAQLMVRSRRWWRRAVALRALGLIEARESAAWIVAALDDPHADVRAAALDALADLRDPLTLDALVVRLLDTTLPRGRRVAALAAFGDGAELLLLELAQINPSHRLGYARALAICGTARSRAQLCRWAARATPEERAAAFEALAHVGLDDASARLAIEALEAPAAAVRAAAARALAGWTASHEAPVHLARHLDDAWVVAAQAARTLRSMGPDGVEALRTSAARDGLAGLLARQMLWEAQASL
jgi:hypothetical protein